jgi:hypothetical protein
MQFMLNQFPKNFGHISRLPYEDIPIFLEEFDEHEFPFVVQILAYVSNLGRFLREQWDYFAEGVLCLDGCLGGLGLGHDQVWGGEGSTKAYFKSLSSADVVSLSTVSQLSLSQLKARLMPPLMEMTPRVRGIFKSKKV